MYCGLRCEVVACACESFVLPVYFTYCDLEPCYIETGVFDMKKSANEKWSVSDKEKVGNDYHS